MFCTKCGTPCGEGQRFCNNCGAPLEAAAAAAPVEPEAPAAEVPFAEEPVIAEAVENVEEKSAEAAEAVEEEAGEAFAAAEDAAEEAIEVVPAAAEPAVEEPVFAAPVFEQPPVYQPPVEQPQFQAPPVIEQPPFAPGFIPPAPLKKKSGVAKWLVRIVISCLPLLVTYMMILINGTGLFNKMASSYEGFKTLSIILLAIIGISIIVQISALLTWALRKKGDPATRDWAVGFIIAAIAVIVVISLFALGYILFTDMNVKPGFFETIGSFMPSVSFIRGLILVL